MFTKIIDKLKDFEDHHQVVFAIIVVLGVVCFSWGIEKLLEEYAFPKKSVYNYIVAMAAGLLILALTKHVILHVM